MERGKGLLKGQEQKIESSTNQHGNFFLKKQTVPPHTQLCSRKVGPFYLFLDPLAKPPLGPCWCLKYVFAPESPYWIMLTLLPQLCDPF